MIQIPKSKFLIYLIYDDFERLYFHLVINTSPFLLYVCFLYFISVKVKFTVVNNLQDFSSLKFIWSPEKALQETRGRLISLHYSVIALVAPIV